MILSRARFESTSVGATGALIGAFVAALCCAGEARAAASPWDNTGPAQVRLVAESTAVGTAESVRLGLHFRLDPGWKIYWRSPGDAGIPPRLDWSRSRNLTDLEISWPAPQRISVLGFESAGYGDEVVQVLNAPPPFGDAAHDAMDPAGPFAAGRTLSAGFVGEESGRGIECLDHAGRLIHDDHSPGTRHAAGGHKGVKVHGYIDFIGGQYFG